MATVREVLRKNLEAAKVQLEFFGFTPGKIRIKPIGGGEYRCWCDVGGSGWEDVVDADDAFKGYAMEGLMRSFIEAFTTMEPTVVNEWGSYHDYRHVAGEDTGMLAEAVETIDCRMMHYEEHELEMFWATDAVEFIPDRLDEIIGDAPLVVYHRKGKDWCVAPRIDHFDVAVYYLDGDRNVRCWTQIEGCMQHNVEETERVQACSRFIQGCKDDLEIRCIALRLTRKAVSMETFIPELGDKETLREKAFDFCCNYYQKNNSGVGWNRGFNGDFPVVSDRETFVGFLREVGAFKHQPESALKDSMKLYRLGEKFGFVTRFDFSSEESVAVEFLFEDSYSIHVDANEFEEHDCNWIEVYREVVRPQVQRRKEIEKMNALKAKVGKNLKEVAKKLWVRFKDSIDAGNCVFGSTEFIKRHQISLEKLGAIRGDALLELEDTEFTRRIIYALSAKHPEVLEGLV